MTADTIAQAEDLPATQEGRYFGTPAELAAFRVWLGDLRSAVLSLREELSNFADADAGGLLSRDDFAELSCDAARQLVRVILRENSASCCSREVRERVLRAIHPLHAAADALSSPATLQNASDAGEATLSFRNAAKILERLAGSLDAELSELLSRRPSPVDTPTLPALFTHLIGKESELEHWQRLPDRWEIGYFGHRLETALDALAVIRDRASDGGNAMDAVALTHSLTAFLSEASRASAIGGLMPKSEFANYVDERPVLFAGQTYGSVNEACLDAVRRALTGLLNLWREQCFEPDDPRPIDARAIAGALAERLLHYGGSALAGCLPASDERELHSRRRAEERRRRNGPFEGRMIEPVDELASREFSLEGAVALPRSQAAAGDVEPSADPANQLKPINLRKFFGALGLAPREEPARKTLPAGTDGAAGPLTIVSPNDERDAWLYREVTSDRPSKTVVAELKKVAKANDWTPLETWPSCTAAARRYAIRKGLPKPMPRGGKRSERR